MSSDNSRVTVTVGESQYTLWSAAGSIGTFAFPKNVAAYVPATALPSGSEHGEVIEGVRKRLDADDVWNADFGEYSLVSSKDENDETVSRFNVGKPNQRNTVMRVTTALPVGPYLINTKTGVISSVARLYPDPLHAFLGGGIIYDPVLKKYKSLNINSYLVPSRTYFKPPTPSQPLAGLRFAVKDVIDIAGLKTSNGSRGWSDVYPAAEESAPFVRKLTDAGAVLVGKLNCTQFCDGQDPAERFEEVTPFNPRGDGYQNPSSSSSGSAAAAAGYDWLDFTIGTDTGGSIRHPAGVNGVYGIRPSLGSVESSGMTASSFMDTVGAFARSADILDRVLKVMTTSPTKSTKSLQQQPSSSPPTTPPRYKLLYPIRSKNAEGTKWFPHPESQQPNPALAQAEAIFERVVAQLESHLACKRQTFNIDDLWRATHPGTMDADLVKATGKIYQRLVYRATAKDVIDPFIEKHKAQRDGRLPYLEPVFRRRYEYGAHRVSQSEFDAAVRDFGIYRDWLRDVLFSSSTDGPGEVVVLIFPQSWGTPNYRDESKATPPTAPKGKAGDLFWEGFSVYSISYASGCPDVTVPVGQTAYQSRITEHEEWLPVSLSVLSQPGNDLVLTALLKELEETGILRAVDTGSMTYKQ